MPPFVVTVIVVAAGTDSVGELSVDSPPVTAVTVTVSGVVEKFVKVHVTSTDPVLVHTALPLAGITAPTGLAMAANTKSAKTALSRYLLMMKADLVDVGSGTMFSPTQYLDNPWKAV